MKTKKNMAMMDEATMVASAEKVTAMAIKEEITVMAIKVEDIIPDNERCMDAPETSVYAVAVTQGYFSEGIGMARVKTESGPTFYANIHIDETGRKQFEFRQQFPNGDFSPMITIRQSDLLLAVNNNFKASNISVPQLKARLNKFLANIVSDFLDMGIETDDRNIYNILMTMYQIQSQLPVYSEWNEKTNRMDFYRDVVDAIHGRGRFQTRSQAYTAKAYYPLSYEEMDFVASQFKLSATELARKLDRFGFLYRTPSATGYQVKVRICSDEAAKDLGISPYDNCYCVLKLDYISQQRLNANNP